MIPNLLKNNPLCSLRYIENDLVTGNFKFEKNYKTYFNYLLKFNSLMFPGWMIIFIFTERTNYKCLEFKIFNFFTTRVLLHSLNANAFVFFKLIVNTPSMNMPVCIFPKQTVYDSLYRPCKLETLFKFKFGLPFEYF